MKNNVEALQNVQAEAGVALAQDVDCEIQQVEVVKTIDHEKNPDNDKTWKGYMCRFGNTSAGVPKVIPISAGRLLSVQQETGIEVFSEGEDGLTLTNLEFGITNGSPVFA